MLTYFVLAVRNESTGEWVEVFGHSRNTVVTAAREEGIRNGDFRAVNSKVIATQRGRECYCRITGRFVPGE